MGGKCYGVPYRGSKNSIAPWVVDNLPEGEVLVDIFAGGCAVAQAALESGKWRKVIANDASDAPELFMQAVRGDWADGGAQFEAHRAAGTLVPDRETFHALKGSDPYVGLCWGFGNNRSDYLWSPEMERVKLPAARMLAAATVRERYRLWHAFIRALRDWLQGPEGLQRLQRLQGLQGLEGLQRLQGMQGLQGLQRLEISRLDYREVDIPASGAVVYADPPYPGTNCRGYPGFDYAAFEEWLASVPYPVYVSGYGAPAGCIEVARVGKTCSASAAYTSHVVERLFVQKRFADRERGGDD